MIYALIMESFYDRQYIWAFSSILNSTAFGFIMNGTDYNTQYRLLCIISRRYNGDGKNDIILVRIGQVSIAQQ